MKIFVSRLRFKVYYLQKPKTDNCTVIGFWCVSEMKKDRRIIVSIRDFFQLVFVEFADLWFWPIIIVGLMVLAIFVMAFLVGFSYENRILKSVNKINSYFLTKPFITEENLVEFNLKMK